MSVKLDQALVSAFIAGGFGLAIAHENYPYNPVPQTPYAELLVMQNDMTPGTLDDSNDTDGIFRVILRYPPNTGAIAAKKKADDIFSVFKIGQKLSYEGITLWIMGNRRDVPVSVPGVDQDSSWYKLVLTMPYRATLAR